MEHILTRNHGVADKTTTQPGDEDLAELDAIMAMCIPNANEIVTLHSHILGFATKIQRGHVFKLASTMSSVSQIAAVLGIDKNTVTKNFNREVKMGHAFGRQRLLTRFYNLAVYGTNPADRIFALKNWAGMTDSGMTEALEELEDGVEFVVRRPTRPVEKLTDTAPALEQAADDEAA